MQVTLVRAPMTLSKYASAAPAVPPIGLAYVAASVVVAGHSVSVVDSIGEAIESYVPYGDNALYRGLTIEEIVQKVPRSDVIGISVMFSQDWPLAAKLIKELKKANPNCLFIIGGEHSSAEPQGALEDCPELDYVVVGEGDITFPELVSCIANNGDVSLVGSVYWRASDGEIKNSPRRPRNRDLANVPWPAWDLFPLENYLSGGHGWGVNRGRSMPIVASRGCPYQCTFCSNPNMWTTRWVVRPVDDVIKEIEYYISKYSANNFDFQDLTAIVKKEWIKDFCEELIKKNLNITWQLPTGTRTEAIDEEVAHLLFASGCKNITYAPESGSDEVLKRIKKKIRVQAVCNSASGCVKAGLDVKFNFIYGFPEDTYSNLIDSTKLMIRLAYIGVSDISIAPFSPYPGSELFHQLQQKGKIPAKLDEDFYRKIPFSDMSSTVSWCERIDSISLNRARNISMVLFYLVSYLFHPSRPFKRIYNFIKGTEETRMDKALGDMKRRFRLSKNRKAGLRPGSVEPF